jgi:hypothetical protein
LHYKDAILDQLAGKANVAQFVSFSPDLSQRYARIFGYEANYVFSSLQDAIETILFRSPESSVNIRSFEPSSPKTQEFIYGLKSTDAIERNLKRLANNGLYTIVNETIDVCDGGVSGVLLGDVIEFAPCDTPRCVEKPSTAALPSHLGLHLLKIIYGFTPTLDYPPNTRVEFSIHPLKRGFLHEHTIVWELEEVEKGHSKAQIYWPNRFSRFIGDKVYGLLIAHLLELPVPETTVISRRIAPFSFGQSTGSAEVWIRTCPTVQMPGKFSTYRGWHDPFELMAFEDPEGDSIASIIAQKGVEATYSGALVVSEKLSVDGQEEIIVEGTQGFGDEFMLGRKRRSTLPNKIISSVKALYQQAAVKLGPVRMEWVADSQKIWIVQLHSGTTKSSGSIIYPGKALSYHQFDVERGLEELRKLISSIEGSDQGIVLVGDVGITSHLGDVLRRAKVPSAIASTREEVDAVLRVNECL